MVKLELTKEQYNLVIEGLMELPAKRVMEFVLDLDRKVKKQINEIKEKTDGN